MMFSILFGSIITPKFFKINPDSPTLVAIHGTSISIDSQIEFDGITYPQPAPGAPHGWKIPDRTEAVETISKDELLEAILYIPNF